MQRISITIEDQLKAELDHITAKGERAAFISQAIQKATIQNRLAILLTHLLKWQYQAQRRSKSWDFTITEQRIKLGKLLSENPGLMPELQVMIADAYADAVRKAAYETGITKSVFPVAFPWTEAQVMDEQYYPE